MEKMPIYPQYEESANIVDHYSAEIVRMCHIRILHEGEYWLSFYKCSMRYKRDERVIAVANIEKLMRRDAYVYQHATVPSTDSYDLYGYPLFTKDPDQTPERERVMKLVKEGKL